MDTFGDFGKVEYDDARIVIIPVPYDGTSTWIKGADKGPEALLEASFNLEFYDIETDSEVWKRGIFTDNPVIEKSSPEAMYAAVLDRVQYHLNNKKYCVLVGGEHSVTVGAAEAHARKYDDLSVLQFDAHTDLRPEYEGSAYNHACVMSRIKEFASISQVGIRSMDSCEKEYLDRDRVFFAREIKTGIRPNWVQELVSTLNENVYITIDLDAFDPAFVPDTGTPEPGGLDWYDIIGALKAVCAAKNVVGFDIVELCPSGYNKASAFLAAKLLYKVLSYRFER